MPKFTKKAFLVLLSISATPSIARNGGFTYDTASPILAFAAAHGCVGLGGAEPGESSHLSCGKEVIASSVAREMALKSYRSSLLTFINEYCTLPRRFNSKISCQTGRSFDKAELFPPLLSLAPADFERKLKATSSLGDCDMVAIPDSRRTLLGANTFFGNPKAVYRCRYSLDGGAQTGEYDTTADVLLQESVRRALHAYSPLQFRYAPSSLSAPANPPTPTAATAYALVNGCSVFGYTPAAAASQGYQPVSQLDTYGTRQEAVARATATPAFFWCEDKGLVPGKPAIEEASLYKADFESLVAKRRCEQKDLAVAQLTRSPLVCAGKVLSPAYLRAQLRVPHSALSPLPGYRFQAPGACKVVGVTSFWYRQSIYRYDSVYACRRAGDPRKITYLTPSDVQVEQTRRKLTETAPQTFDMPHD